MELYIDPSIVNNVVRNFEKNQNSSSYIARKNLHKFYKDKIHEDSKIRSELGFGSITYDIFEFSELGNNLHTFFFLFCKDSYYKYEIKENKITISWY